MTGGVLAIALDLISAAVSAQQGEALTAADQIDRIADGKLQAFAGTIAPFLPELKPERIGRLTPFLRQQAPDAFRDRLAPIECARIAKKFAATLRAGKRPATSQ